MPTSGARPAIPLPITTPPRGLAAIACRAPICWRDNEEMDRVRIDKWLWAARFFKTRSLAGRACELGRIECGGTKVKPAREIHPGDRLRVSNDSGDFEIE